jgi:hypothetical protein
VNHGDAAPLAAGSIIPASFLSCRAYYKKKKKNTTITSSSLGVYASATSTIAFSFDFSSASPEVNYCPIWTSQVAKSIYSF